MSMPPRVRKLALTAHVAASVGWLGAVGCFLAFAVVGLTSQDAQTVRGAYLVMEPAAWYVLVPLALASLLTGMVQSLGTTWGLLRHYWVLFKLVINLVATIVLLTYMETFSVLAAVQHAREQQAHMRKRAAELAQVRAARAAAKRMLERKVARLQIRHGALRASSARIIHTIRAEEAARRRAAAAARRAALRGHPSGPTVLADEGGGIGGPDTDSYQRLTPTAKRLYGLVARIFDVHTIGGWRPSGSVPGSDHPHGRAIDVMIGYPGSDGHALGWRIATWAAGNAWALDVKYVIFHGRIWTPGRGWQGYRHPADPCNCNPTLRHDDHVHISVRS